MQKIIVIYGPTASGKTGLAVDLAKKLGGEVVSADSRQVYRELTIGTEKVSEREMRGVPHHCIDIASPRRACSVERWRKCAEKAIHAIHKRGHVPIIAGGTGFYIDALVYNTKLPAVKPNAVLRKTLESKTSEELLEILIKLDSARARTVEQKNPRRLIRAIEIATALGSVPVLTKRAPQYAVTWVRIDREKATLFKHIEKRLRTTIRRGLVAETKKLRAELGLSWKRINELGLEYRSIGAYLRGELTKEEAFLKMMKDLRAYVRRQLLWFKHYPVTYHVTNNIDRARVLREISRRYK